MQRFILLLLLAAGLSLMICCGDDKSSEEKSSATNESILDPNAKAGSTLEETIAIISNCWLNKDPESFFACYSDKMVREEANVMGIKADNIQEIRKQLAAQFKENIDIVEEAPDCTPVDCTYKIEDREDISNSKCKIKLTVKCKEKDGARVSSTAVYVFVKKKEKWLVDEVLPYRAEKKPVIDAAKIPDQPVSGQVMGRPFQPDQFEISESTNLNFWVGDRIFPVVKVSITLPLGFGESPAGQSFDFHPDKGDGFRPMIQISLKSDSGEPIFKSFRNHYRLKLSFGEAVEHSLPGRIYLRLPDKKTEIAGVFHVAAQENPAQPPKKRHRPYVHGRIGFSPPEQRVLMAGYAGKGYNGKVYKNGVGLKLTPRDTYSDEYVRYVQSTTFKPRTTVLWRDDEGFLHFRHVRLEPGDYILSIKWGNDLIAHQWQRVNKDSTLCWEVAIDLAESGSLLVEVPDLKESERVWLLPLNAYGVLPEGVDNRHLWRLPFHLGIKPEYNEGSAMFRLLPPGAYLVLYNDYRQKVKVISGECVKIGFRY